MVGWLICWLSISPPGAARPATSPTVELLRYRLGTLEMAVRDLGQTHGANYPRAVDYQGRIRALRQRLDAGGTQATSATTSLEADLVALQQEAMLAHPLLQSNQLLLVKRRPRGKPALPVSISACPRTTSATRR